MAKMSEIKLSSCNICGKVPRMRKIQLVDGETLLRKEVRGDTWYQIECRSFRHDIRIHDRNKMTVGMLWNELNGGQAQG